MTLLEKCRGEVPSPWAHAMRPYMLDVTDAGFWYTRAIYSMPLKEVLNDKSW
jgi:hypothetical protein